MMITFCFFIYLTGLSYVLFCLFYVNGLGESQGQRTVGSSVENFGFLFTQLFYAHFFSCAAFWERLKYAWMVARTQLGKHLILT